MFSENQIKALSYNLDDSRIKTIDKAGMKFSYLETYDCINVANSIFNYMWDYTITQLKEVDRSTNSNGNFVITYSAIVKIRIYDNQRNFIQRQDTGVGIGTARTVGEAIDNASKSAVSDSLKRALRSMGAQFGNNLYSKEPNLNNSQNYHQQAQQPAQLQQQYKQTPNQQQTVNNAPQDYSLLYAIGLQVHDDGNGNLIVSGEDQYNKRDSIKACGFKFSANSKLWWKPIQQQAA